MERRSARGDPGSIPGEQGALFHECFSLTVCETNMDDNQRLSLFQAQTQNVRDLLRAWDTVNRQINCSIRQSNDNAVEVNTKLLALIYCAFAEAIFSKLIHTPYGLELGEIEQVKCVKGSVKNRWVKCSELAIRKLEGGKHNHQPNVSQKLKELIEKFIHDPSLIRNKLGHGQWSVALNRENTAINEGLTQKIAGHTVVELLRRKKALQDLAAIIEDMIESPNRAHPRDYWPRLVCLENGLIESCTWTLDEKKTRLLKKQSLSHHARNTGVSVHALDGPRPVN